ncbi:hypothetical protein WR25_12131 [Diploscapter pachys]|uniref:Uncharacterized protein n=1 Tax=Diploscapter pachys TaxID=2018661 RepID=A0A2A2KZZ5_9BILA|nr:hypothetical protein WR25_12131 [Diploscapter pachys]
MFTGSGSSRQVVFPTETPPVSPLPLLSLPSKSASRALKRGQAHSPAGAPSLPSAPLLSGSSQPAGQNGSQATEALSSATASLLATSSAHPTESSSGQLIGRPSSAPLSARPTDVLDLLSLEQTPKPPEPLPPLPPIASQAASSSRNSDFYAVQAPSAHHAQSMMEVDNLPPSPAPQAALADQPPSVAVPATPATNLTPLSAVDDWKVKKAEMCKKAGEDKSLFNKTFSAKVAGFHLPRMTKNGPVLDFFVWIGTSVFRVALRGKDHIEAYQSLIKKDAELLCSNFMMSTFYVGFDAWTHKNLDTDVEFTSVDGQKVKSALRCRNDGTSIFSHAYTCSNFPPFNGTFRSIRLGMQELRVKSVVLSTGIAIQKDGQVAEAAVQVGIEDDHSMGFVIYRPVRGKPVDNDAISYFTELQPDEEIVIISGAAGIYEGKMAVMISDIDCIDLTPPGMRSMIDGSYKMKCKHWQNANQSVWNIDIISCVTPSVVHQEVPMNGQVVEGIYSGGKHPESLRAELGKVVCVACELFPQVRLALGQPQRIKSSDGLDGRKCFDYLSSFSFPMVFEAPNESFACFLMGSFSKAADRFLSDASPADSSSANTDRLDELNDALLCSSCR